MTTKHGGAAENGNEELQIANCKLQIANFGGIARKHLRRQVLNFQIFNFQFSIFNSPLSLGPAGGLS